MPLATSVGGSTNVCVIRSWELFSANEFSQNGKPSSYLGAYLLEKCTFSGCSRQNELLFLLKHLMSYILELYFHTASVIESIWWCMYVFASAMFINAIQQS